MYKILEKEMLLKQPDQAKVEGYVLIQSYGTQPTKNGGVYLQGSLEAKGTLPFKAWSRSKAFDILQKKNFSGVICRVKAETNLYNGIFSLILQDVISLTKEEFAEAELETAKFLEPGYDGVSGFQELEQIVKSHVSENAGKLFDAVFTEPVRNRFQMEYAAIHNHDNVLGGLLHHSLKVTKLAGFSKEYPNLAKRMDPDVLYLGAAIHDIGKILEYQNGTISGSGKLISHTVSGIVALERSCAAQAVSLCGPEFYDRLLSVVGCHHGPYGELPRTVEAYVIFLMDCLDSDLTMLDQMVKNANGRQVKYKDMKLS